MFDRLWPNASPRLLAWLTTAAILAAVLQTVGFIFRGSWSVGLSGILFACLALRAYVGAKGRSVGWALLSMFPLIDLLLGYLMLRCAAPVAIASFGTLLGFCVLVFIHQRG